MNSDHVTTPWIHQYDNPEFIVTPSYMKTVTFYADDFDDSIKQIRLCNELEASGMAQVTSESSCQMADAC